MKGEIIPDGEFLYRYVKPESFPDDQAEVPHGIFIDPNLSCDWAKFQKNPERSYHVREGKTWIVRITVCDEMRNPRNPARIRQEQPAWRQNIVHDPIAKGEDPFHPDIANLSHSLVKGPKKNHITDAIARNSIFYKKLDPNSVVQTEAVIDPIGAKTFIPSLLFALFAIALIVLILKSCSP
jgi:hypothetical protein